MINLIDLWLQYREKNKDDKEGVWYEDFAFEVGKLYKAGSVSKADIIELGNVVPGKVLIEISTHMQVGKSGLTYYEAREQAHKHELMYLSYVESNGGDVLDAFKKGISQSIELTDEILDDTYDKTKLEILKTIPLVQDWDTEGIMRAKAVELYKKHFINI